jgi:hypothetical protein
MANYMVVVCDECKAESRVDRKYTFSSMRVNIQGTYGVDDKYEFNAHGEVCSPECAAKWVARYPECMNKADQELQSRLAKKGTV